MSAIREALFEAMTSHPGVAAMAGKRVYPVRMPQAPQLPAVTYRQTGGAREHSHDGASGLADADFEVVAWASTYDAATDLAAEVRKSLDGLKALVKAVDVQAVFIEGEADDYDDDVQAYSVRLEFSVAFGEETA